MNGSFSFYAVIYYMSIPDTAPEFLDAERLEDYLNGAVERVKK